MAFPAVSSYSPSMLGKPSWHHLWEEGPGRWVSSKTVPNSRFHPCFHGLSPTLQTFFLDKNKTKQNNSKKQKTKNWFRYFIFFPHFCSIKGWHRRHSLSTLCPGWLSNGCTWTWTIAGNIFYYINDCDKWFHACTIFPTNHNGCRNKAVSSPRVCIGTLKGVLCRNSKVYLS